MIKKIFIGISFLLSVTVDYAQKIKIKGEEVRIDDVPVLLCSGKMGLISTDVLYRSLQGDSLLTSTAASLAKRNLWLGWNKRKEHE